MTNNSPSREELEDQWREKSTDILEQCFPKLNEDDVSKPSSNNRSGAILMLGLLDNLHRQLLSSQDSKLKKNIGMLRQWLNEKPTDRLITNEDLMHWLTL